MQQPTVTLTDDPDPALRDQIGAVLVRHNETQVGPHERRHLIVTVRDPNTNAIIGGLTGRTALGVFFIDLLALPTDLRGHGLGAQILQMAEDEARKRGCRNAALNTANFQAPDFYLRHGYRILGEVDGIPGVKRIYMTKDLTRQAEAAS